jgi:hypothetical protein
VAERVKVLSHGMAVVQEQRAARFQRRRDPGQPLVEVADRAEHVSSCEHEVEAAPVELERQVVDVSVVVRHVGSPLAGDLDLLGGHIDRGHERAPLHELSRRLAGGALQVKDVLPLDVRDEIEDLLRDQQ